MARTTRLLASLAALSFIVASCGGSDSASDTTAAASTTAQELTFTPVAEGKLTVCSDAPYEPFEFQNEDKTWTGFDMDIMTSIAQRYGLALEVTVQPFDGIWLAPKAGTCDVVASSLTITEERAANAAFSEGYFDSFQSLLVRTADKDTLNTLASLSGKTVAVQTGTTGEEYAKANAPDAKIQSFDDAAAMFLALESKQVDAVLQDFPINAFRATKMGTSVVSIKFDTESEKYGFATSQENTELVKAINESLAEFRTNGVYDGIYKKYFG
ncbi:MAG: basic amino acid ABC transporter substrate-binding protein [Actinobacteria bacterium]|nr:basic amino acid ABC transporter substrate-binding protein [Actinomycetota bacterium]